MDQVRQVTKLGRYKGQILPGFLGPTATSPLPGASQTLPGPAVPRCHHLLLDSGPQHPTQSASFLMCHSHPCLPLVPSTPWAVSAWKPALITTRSHFPATVEGIRAVVVHRMLLNMGDVHLIAMAPAFAN